MLGDTDYYIRFGFSVEAAEGFISPYSGGHFMMPARGAGEPPSAGRLIYPLHPMGQGLGSYLISSTGCG